MSPLPDNWIQMTSEEKMDARLSGWISTEDKKLETFEIVQQYKERTQRYRDVVKLQQPDRVPIILSAGNYVADYSNISHGDMFYDYDKAVQAFIKFHTDFDLDYSAAGNFFLGKVFDRLDYKLYRIPGNALQANQPFQFVEGEYMSTDEYDTLIDNPEGYLMRTYIPRIMGALGGWTLMPGMLGSTELPFVPFMMASFGTPTYAGNHESSDRGFTCRF